MIERSKFNVERSTPGRFLQAVEIGLFTVAEFLTRPHRESNPARGEGRGEGGPISPPTLLRCVAPLVGLLLFIRLSAPAATNLTGLRAAVTAHLNQERFAAAAWGVKIVSLDSSQTLFEHNAGKLLKPASNAKLFTGALALDRLGPDFRIKTSLYSAARPDKSGTLRGDLIVYGRGDPCFAERFHDGDYTNILRPVVEAVVAAGIKQIKGDLVGDESFFRGPPFGTQWTWDDLQRYYGAESSALSVQDNTVDLIFKPGARVGLPCRITTLPETSYLTFSNRTITMEAGSRRRISLYRPVGENVVHVSGWMPVDGTNWVDAVSVHRPALWFVTLLKEALAKHGIRVGGKVRTVDRLEREVKPIDFGKLVELGSVSSRPLSEIVTRMMKPSQNLYAHLLLLQVGAQSAQAPASWQTTEDAGLAELEKFLTGPGIPKSAVLLEEGSGLSRGALVTPDATLLLLKFMTHHRHAAAFRKSLPIAGVDGTLRNRMKGTVAAGNVRAKTGTLRYVNTLSGYVTSKARENIVFSLMLNNYGGDDARAALDHILVTLAEMEFRSGP
jgi:D-alanyl-D-alanine carboxypeptidase/D-alanyl-D-alanine-endopeptidase (penicillin-binding protein 4)